MGHDALWYKISEFRVGGKTVRVGLVSEIKKKSNSSFVGASGLRCVLLINEFGRRVLRAVGSFNQSWLYTVFCFRVNHNTFD